MPKIKYIDKEFYKDALLRIEQINNIIEEYLRLGYELTLRQLYYRLVLQGDLPNTDKNYKKLSALVNDARLMGLIDWYAIPNRIRNKRHNSHWNKPRDIISTCSNCYALDKWQNQPYYVEIWVEKDVLIGIVENTASELDVPCFSCRGYTSQSEMWIAAQRFIRKQDKRKRIIIHLGDHDPSGIDMTRDIKECMQLFGADVKVKRVALTMEQIKEFSLPPNPEKLNESWELDALDPPYLAQLIRNEISELIDEKKWDKVVAQEADDLEILHDISENYQAVANFVKTLD